MKTKFTLVLLFIFTAFIAGKAQQVPNGNFDNWTGNDPAGWYDIDQYLAGLGLTGETLVSEETTPGNVAPGCTASAKLQTEYISEASLNLTALLSVGPFSINSTTGAISISGIPYAYRPDSLSFKYKYEVVQPDSAQFGFSLTKWNGTSETTVGGLPPGYIDFLTDTGSAFHTLTMSPGYLNSDTPDSVSIFFISGGNHSVAGNTLWIDTIEMIFNGSTTDVKNLNLTTQMSLFPVPTTNTLNVSVSQAMVNTTYNIVDMLGNVVAKGTIESTSNRVDVSALAVGNYLYTIIDNDKRIAAQGKFMINR